MELTKIFNAKAIAANYTEAASNKIPYLGTGFFPSKKKASIDLKWLVQHTGLPISLMPSAFDAKSTFRDRVGIVIEETEMAFFRESFLVKEKDEQDIMRVQDANDPYAAEVLDRIFGDARNLIEGADVVPERMRMQLLAPIGGNMGIAVVANGVNYTYNYDPDGSWKKEHYMKIETAEDKWSAADTCDPIADLEAAIDAQETATGEKPELALMSKATFKMIKDSKKVQSGVLAMNATAMINYTNDLVKKYVEDTLKIKVIIYSKQYKDEAKVAHKFYPDNIVALLPNGNLGSTWYGTTPEEARLSKKEGASVSLVNTGVSVAVTITDDPVNTKTTVSEIVLPSFERRNNVYALEVAGD